MDNEKKTKIESLVFQRLVDHLQNRTDVQNIDLMNLSGFCRNCLSKWYAEAAKENGIEIGKEKSREVIHGMPHSVWKDKYQNEADESQKSKFQTSYTKEH